MGFEKKETLGVRQFIGTSKIYITLDQMAHWSLMILQFWIDRVNFKGLERIQKDRKGHTRTRNGSERNHKNIWVL